MENVPASNNPWRSRGYLPHFSEPLLLQSLTLRLYDALPEPVVQSWKAELAWVERLPAKDPRELELRKRIARYEDAGYGSCWLQDERIAALVENALLHFDGQRYRLIAWCIMPNHLHGLIETSETWPLAGIIHSWKSYTAHVANQILERTGDFWFREYFDRFIRDDRHFRNAVSYIEENPVKAGFVQVREEWRSNGQYSIFSWDAQDATIVSAAGQSIVTVNATVTEGLFLGQTLVEVIVIPALNPAACLTEPGITETNGAITLTILPL